MEFSHTLSFLRGDAIGNLYHVYAVKNVALEQFLAGNQQTSIVKVSQKSMVPHEFCIVKFQKMTHVQLIHNSPMMSQTKSSTPSKPGAPGAPTPPGVSGDWPRPAEAWPSAHPATGLQRRRHTVRAALVSRRCSGKVVQ